MPILNLGYHCNSFEAANIKDKILVKPKNRWLFLARETMIYAQIAHLSLKQLIQYTCLFSTATIMRSAFVTQKSTILTVLIAGHSAYSIVSTSDIYASTILRLHLEMFLRFRCYRHSRTASLYAVGPK